MYRCIRNIYIAIFVFCFTYSNIYNINTMRGKITPVLFRHHDMEAYGEVFLTVEVSKTDWPVTLLIRPEEFYRLWCVVVCDLETSTKRRPVLKLGCWVTGKKN